MLLGFSGTRLRRFAAIAGLVAVAAGCEATGPAGTGNQVDVSRAVPVGLLVPLDSGNPQTDALAQSLVQAAQLAQGGLSGAEIDLRIYPTKGTAGDAAAAADRAIAEGAEILVGPLYSTEAAAVGTIASKSGIPVLSFSNNAAVAAPNLYVLGVTYESVAQRLVAFSGARGLRNIGIVYPDGVDGEAGRTAVERAVAANSATLAATGSYALNIDGIEAASTSIAEKMKSSGANAIVFTDTPTGGLGFITSALRADGLTAGSVQFMGLTRWDASPESLSQPSLSGGWFALPDPALGQQFRSRFEAKYGVPPHDLAGIAFDAVAAVGALIGQSRAAGDSYPFSPEKLTGPNGFAGVNGIFRLKPDGTNERGLAVMQIIAGAASIVDPAPRSFGGAQS